MNPEFALWLFLVLDLAGMAMIARLIIAARRAPRDWS